jgi:hypothetical protein
LAQKIGQEAERFRKELAIEWLGHELGEWEDKCPIHVELSMHCGGETSFAFVMDSSGGSRPRDWKMSIFGTPERLLDSVLPHEVTHTIFASHFGQPLPRWADEGACTVVEHESERAKNHQMLMDFLMNNRGIPFNRMFEMKQYPDDILPLYAQGHSLSKFLIMQKGKRYFLDYVSAGLYAETQGPLLQGWNRSTEKFYGYRNLSDLQESWITWVRAGSKEVSSTDLAGNANRDSSIPKTFVVAPVAQRDGLGDPKSKSVLDPSLQVASSELEESNQPPMRHASASWYLKQSQGRKESSQKLPIPYETDASNRSSNDQLKFQPIDDIANPVDDHAAQRDHGKSTIWR